MIEVKQKNTQEFNLLRVYQALIPIEKLKLTSNINKCVCAQIVNKTISMRNLKQQKNFVNKMETQYEKNHSGAAKPRISTI
jgi:hypothetical protein